MLALLLDGPCKGEKALWPLLVLCAELSLDSPYGGVKNHRLRVQLLAMLLLDGPYGGEKKSTKLLSLRRRGHLATEPAISPSHSSEKLTPDVDVSLRPPRTGVDTASGVRGLGVGGIVVIKVRIGVARARGAGGGRLQANELN